MLRRLIRRNHGILLVTGPTGSGKTTTLYAAINDINTPEKSIITVEEPVDTVVESGRHRGCVPDAAGDLVEIVGVLG